MTHWTRKRGRRTPHSEVICWRSGYPIVVIGIVSESTILIVSIRLIVSSWLVEATSIRAVSIGRLVWLLVTEFILIVVLTPKACWVIIGVLVVIISIVSILIEVLVSS